MSAIDDGGPAFPVPYPGHHEQPGGMSLRDWFAGQAIAGLLADGPNLRRLAEANRDIPATTARSAYAIADHLLMLRKQP